MLTASLVRTRRPSAVVVMHWTRLRIDTIGSFFGPTSLGKVTVVPKSTASSQETPLAGIPQNGGKRRLLLLVVLLHVVEEGDVLLEQLLVAVHQVEVVPLVPGGVHRHVRRAEEQRPLRAAGLGERVELRVQQPLAAVGAAARVALVDEVLLLDVGAEVAAHHLHRLGVLVVVQEHLDVHAALLGGDQRVRHRDPVEGVQRDPDDRRPCGCCWIACRTWRSIRSREFQPPRGLLK